MSPKIDLAVGIVGLVLGAAALGLSALGIEHSQIWIAALPLIAFGLNAVLRGRKNLRIEKGMGVYTLAADPRTVRFLKHSYRSWQSGRLAGLSDQYERKTRKRPLAQLVEGLLSDAGMAAAVAAAFKIHAPEADEIFLAIVPGAYLLTHRRLYLFEPKGRAIALDEIERYTAHPGSPPSCGITLRSGETLQALPLDRVPGEATLNRLRTLKIQSPVS